MSNVRWKEGWELHFSVNRPIKKLLEDRQSKLDHGVATGQREADISRKPDDLRWPHEHPCLSELLGKVEATKAPGALEEHVKSAFRLGDVIALSYKVHIELITASLNLRYVDEHTIHVLKGMNCDAAWS